MSNDLYPNIFNKIEINKLVIKNRIVMPAMATNLASAFGEVTGDMINYYQTRAKGGVGLIIIENTNIDYPLGTNGAVQLRIDHDRFVPGLSKLSESIKSFGAKACLQINHAGASTSTARVEKDYIVGPSNISVKNGEIPRPLTIPEIYELVNKFGIAAKRAKTAGFDMVEIHAGHSYLIAQFLSPQTNNRTDEFGGSVENMARFCTLILKEVRKNVGEDYPISLRLNADEFEDNARNLNGTLDILEYIVPYIDVLDITVGIGTFEKQLEPMQYAEGWRVYLSEEIKKRYPIPTITVGNIRNPDYVEEVLSSGKADLVAIGRGLICDPNWVKKVYIGENKSIRKCISCNIGCVSNRIFSSLPIKCSLNPDVISEELKGYNINSNLSDNNIVVIGAGPSGIEAACTAAKYGYNVYIFEKENEIGGFLRLIKRLPSKSKLEYFIQYMKERVSKLPNVHIYYNDSPSINELMDLNPTCIINATGSEPNIPNEIHGLNEMLNNENSNIYTIYTLLKNLDKFSDIENKKVIIAGGGAVGLDCAEFFSETGAVVTIIEALSLIGADVEYVTRTHIINKLIKHDVKIYTETCIKGMKDNLIFCNDGEKDLEFEFDIAVICLGLKPNGKWLNLLEELLLNQSIPIYNIGDSNEPRKIINAIYEGKNLVVSNLLN